MLPHEYYSLSNNEKSFIVASVSVMIEEEKKAMKKGR
jgi:hypothetical protein|nr:MAG TPA: hypothetical protein [Caudoviricetes sp.]